MGYVCFYLAVGAACLLWTAIFTAAAARTRSGWTRWLLIAVAVGFPALSLMPWVVLTGALAFRIGLDTAWFGPTLTAECAALVGGIWIAIAGLLPRSDPAAARWPLLRLAACFIVSKRVIAGTLAILDEAARAEGRAARAEAASGDLAWGTGRRCVTPTALSHRPAWLPPADDAVATTRARSARAP